MHVIFTSTHQVKLCSLRTKEFPKGWSGEVDDAVAKAAIKAGNAQEVKAQVAPVDTKADTAKPAKA